MITLRSRRATALRLLGVVFAVQFPAATASGAPDPSPVLSPDPTATPAAEHDVAAPQTVDELMARLRTMPGLFARFEERKTIALLAAPLVNHGTVRFHAPGLLRRTIEKPVSSSVLLLGNDIWLEERGNTERIDLQTHPAARSFVGSFRALLAGDRAALDAHFILSLEVEADAHWELTLRPRTEGMKKIVTSMSIRGKSDQLHQLRIEEATGDVSDTRFFDVDTRVSHSEADVRRYFSAPQP